MRKEIKELLIKSPKYSSKPPTFNNRRLENKSSLNNTEGHSLIHSSYEVETFLDKSHSNHKTKQVAAERKTANLLNKVKSVQRVRYEKDEENNFQDIRKLIMEAYFERLALEKKSVKKTESKYNKYDNSNLEKTMKVRLREEQENQKFRLKYLSTELEALKEQLTELYQENQSLRQVVTNLHQQNENLKAQISQISSKIQSVRVQNKKSEEFSLSKLLELQQFIEHLKNQNQQLQLYLQDMVKNYKKASNKAKNIQICPVATQITICPLESRELDNLIKEFRDIKLELFSQQKKHIANINQIKKQHQKEIFSLRNSFFKNLHFYRNLIKKCTSNQVSETLKQPQELLQAGIIQMDQDFEEADDNDSFSQGKKTN